MVLDRVGKGRVAQLLSDQAWLWARGYEGGGPQADAAPVRALADEGARLEEEALSAKAGKRHVTIERRTVQEEPGEATVTTPLARRSWCAHKKSPGRFSKTIGTDEPGVHRITMDGLTALTVAGEMNSPEFQKVVTTDQPLRPVLENTGGGAFFLGGDCDAAPAPMPAISVVRSGHRFSGNNWLGLKARDAYEVKAITYTPLLSGLAALGIALGLLSLTWYREGR